MSTIKALERLINIVAAVGVLVCSGCAGGKLSNVRDYGTIWGDQYKSNDRIVFLFIFKDGFGNREIKQFLINNDQLVISGLSLEDQLQYCQRQFWWQDSDRVARHLPRNLDRNEVAMLVSVKPLVFAIADLSDDWLELKGDSRREVLMMRFCWPWVTKRTKNWNVSRLEVYRGGPGRGKWESITLPPASTLGQVADLGPRLWGGVQGFQKIDLLGATTLPAADPNAGMLPPAILNDDEQAMPKVR